LYVALDFSLKTIPVETTDTVILQSVKLKCLGLATKTVMWNGRDKITAFRDVMSRSLAHGCQDSRDSCCLHLCDADILHLTQSNFLRLHYNTIL
jgi:hypothetical protein